MTFNRLKSFVVTHLTGKEVPPLVILCFILHVLIVLPFFYPSLDDVGKFDEAEYIQDGKAAGLDNLPALNEYPAVTLFYKLIYIPVQGSDFWFVHSCAIGRFILFTALWASSYWVAKRISGIADPLIMIGFLLVSPVIIRLAQNGSHALFTILSILALGQIILFHREKKLTNLWIASVFLSLALLSRVGEATPVFASFVLLSVVLGISVRRHGAVVAAILVPPVVMVGGYLLAFEFLSEKPPLGTPDYFYLAFEAGHGMAFRERYPGQNYWVDGVTEAREIFGTAQENGYSVITAIRRNPMAYLERVPQLVKAALNFSLSGYGGPLSLWLFVLALYGGIELVRKKQFMLLSILLLWTSYLVIFILLLFQETQLLLPFPVLFCLASVGLTAVVSSLSRKQQLVWSAVLVGLTALTLGRDVTVAYSVSPVVLLTGLWIVWIVVDRYGNLKPVISSAFVFLFGLMLLFKEGAPLEKPRRLGIEADERAMLFLKQNFAENATVASYSPNIPWAADLKYVELTSNYTFGLLRSEQDLQRWMIDNNVEAIYVDDSLKLLEPSTWELIEAQIGKTFEVAFSSDNPDIRVLRVQSAAPFR